MKNALNQSTYFAKIVFLFLKKSPKTQPVAVVWRRVYIILSEKWTILFKIRLLPYEKK